MKIRLNKVQKELNIGLNTIVEFLQKKGIEIKEDPNAVVPEAGYNLLMEAFSTDKNVRIQSDKFTQERQNKGKAAESKPAEESARPAEAAPAATVAKPAEAPGKAEEPVKIEPAIKVTGSIDLEALNRRSKPVKEREKDRRDMVTTRFGKTKESRILSLKAPAIS